MRLVWSSLIACAACSGASDTPDAAGPPLTLGEVRAQIDVTSTDNTVLDVEVSIDTGGADPSGITAAVTVRSSTTDLRQSGVAFGGAVTVGGSLAEDEPVAVTFMLGGARATAMVTMPAGFTVTSVTGNPQTPPLTIMWSPIRTDPMHWEATGYAPSNHQCSVFPPSGDPNFIDTGTLTIDSPFGVAGGNGCTLGFSLYRTREGTAMDHLAAGSYIRAAQRRSGLVPGA